MKNELAFFRTKKGRIIIISVFVVFLIALIIALIVRGLNMGEEQNPEYQPQVDPVSGEVVWNIDEEPEFGEEDVTITLGFYKLIEFGFMEAQFQKIYDKVTEYVAANYPEAKRISFKKDSFDYLDEEGLKSSFEFAVDDKDMFKVNLVTNEDSLEDVEVTIEKE